MFALGLHVDTAQGILHVHTWCHGGEAFCVHVCIKDMQGVLHACVRRGSVCVHTHVCRGCTLRVCTHCRICQCYLYGKNIYKKEHTYVGLRVDEL
jgi:hypothetical protein